MIESIKEWESASNSERACQIVIESTKGDIIKKSIKEWESVSNSERAYQIVRERVK